MLLQDTVLRDGSTRTARVWTYVAGQNILGSPNILRNSKQTSAARLNTPHKRAHTEQQHTSRGGTAVEENLACAHELDSKVQLCCQEHAWPTNTRAQGASWHCTSLSEAVSN